MARLPAAGAPGRDGEAAAGRVRDTRDTNPGEVWEENEFWFELSWRIDPDGSLGIRRYFESPYRPGEKVTVDEYYRWIFENRVPGPAREGRGARALTPLAYMRKYGVVEIAKDVYRQDERPLTDGRARGRGGRRARRAAQADRPTSRRRRWSGEAGVGRRAARRRLAGGRLADAQPQARALLRLGGVVRLARARDARLHRVARVAHAAIDTEAGEMVLVPTFRLPTLIHTRSGNAKYLNEISNTHPLWMQRRRRRAARASRPATWCG